MCLHKMVNPRTTPCGGTLPTEVGKKHAIILGSSHYASLDTMISRQIVRTPGRFSEPDRHLLQACLSECPSG